jgi:hypothetical protein
MPALPHHGQKTRRPARRVPLAEGSEYSRLSVKTLRRYIAAGLITGYRVGPKLLQVDLDEIDAIIRPVPTVRNGAA